MNYNNNSFIISEQETDNLDGCFILNLPQELLQNIFFYLDSVFIFDILPKVCKRFEEIIDDKLFWKFKMCSQWKYTYPTFIDEHQKIDYKIACVSRELEEQRWLYKPSCQNTMKYVDFEKNNLETYSALTSLENGRLVITGSREQTISLIDVEKSIKTSCLTTLASVPKSHKGWIWSLSHCNNLLASGSFDTFLKFRDINTFKELNKINLQSAVLCSQMTNYEVVACGFNGYTHIIDTRTYAENFTQRIHKKPILSIISTPNEIITTGEDCKLVIIDKRQLKIRQRIALPECCITMSLDGNELWMGDVKGSIHLFGPINNRPTLVESMNVGQKIYAISHSSGSMMTLDDRHQFVVYEPCRKPAVLNQFQCQGNKFTYNNGILVSVGQMYLGIHYDKNCIS